MATSAYPVFIPIPTFDKTKDTKAIDVLQTYQKHVEMKFKQKMYENDTMIKSMNAKISARNEVISNLQKQIEYLITENYLDQQIKDLCVVDNQRREKEYSEFKTRSDAMINRE